MKVIVIGGLIINLLILDLYLFSPQVHLHKVIQKLVDAVIFIVDAGLILCQSNDIFMFEARGILLNVIQALIKDFIVVVKFQITYGFIHMPVILDKAIYVIVP